MPKAKQKDFLIYDGKCKFCKQSIQTIELVLGTAIEYIAYQDLEPGFYGISQESFDTSIKFFKHIRNKSTKSKSEIQYYDFYEVHPDAKIYHGAFAVFQALSNKAPYKTLLWLYLYLPLFAAISEAIYSTIARNRKCLKDQCSIV